MSSMVGRKAPDFTLKTSEGQDISLSQLDGQWKVLFFYAKDGSPACKRGCLSFKDQYDLFRSLEPQVEVIGISQNTVSEHKEFKEEIKLPFTLLSDPERNVAESFKEPDHLGALTAKSSIVIGPDNNIHHVEDRLFRTRQHVANILSALSSVTN